MDLILNLIVWLPSLCLTIYIGFILVSAKYFIQAPCSTSSPYLPLVSIIIPARNEAKHIKKCLLSVLNQSYPSEKYEVILVDDQSTDQTAYIARSLSHSYPHLKIIPSNPLPGTVAFKKAAISAGILVSKGEIILQLDADCWCSREWVYTIIRHFDARTSMVCGPVALQEQHGSFIEKIQALESMGLVALGAGSLTGGYGNMCNGANMAYRKELFEQVQGFQTIDHFASGDDELLLQKFRQLSDWQIRFAKCTSAIVSTHCLPIWKDLKAQRLRWVSKAKYYRDRRINIIQSISYLGFVSFPLLVIVGFFQIEYWLLLGALFVLKYSADLVLMIPAAEFFQRKDLLSYLPGLQLVYIPYVLWVGIAGNLVLQYTWKERMVK